MRIHQVAICKPAQGAHTRTNPAGTLVLDFQPLDREECMFVGHEPPRPQCFVKAACAKTVTLWGYMVCVMYLNRGPWGEIIPDLGWALSPMTWCSYGGEGHKRTEGQMDTIQPQVKDHHRSLAATGRQERSTEQIPPQHLQKNPPSWHLDVTLWVPRFLRGLLVYCLKPSSF